MEDIRGKPLEIGSMYACVFVDENGDDTPTASYGDLARFIEYDGVRAVFADADTWEEVSPDFEELHRQAAPIIDPATQGWPDTNQ